MAEERIKAERLRDTIRALRHRNYRIYFFALLISFIGTWMQSVAQSWLIYRLTESAWLLGFVAFIGQVPVLLLAPVGGVLADRRSRFRIVLVAQALAMTQALMLAALTLSSAARAAWTHFRGDVMRWLDVDRDVSRRLIARVRRSKVPYAFAAFTGVDKLSHQRDIQIDYRIIEGANHFFHERIDQLAAEVDDYLATVMRPRRAKVGAR